MGAQVLFVVTRLFRGLLEPQWNLQRLCMHSCMVACASYTWMVQTNTSRSHRVVTIDRSTSSSPDASFGLSL
jgi:hypothetical protein